MNVNGPAFFAAVALFLVVSCPGWAETGMGLIIDKDTKKIRRIDLKNDTILHTTGEFGSNVKHTRFSPDGSKLVYSVEGSNKVSICDLNGKVSKTFTAWVDGEVSWTPSGIWVGGTDKVVLYDPSNGSVKKTVNVSGYRIRVVSHSETLATARTTNPTEVHAVLMDQGNKVIHGGGGCSNVPSPDGKRYTHNLWETGKQHQTMKIEHRDGSTVHYFYIFDLLPYTKGEDWTWNAQAWSSNSDEIIVIPAGKGYPQQTLSTVPWIYNLVTKKAICLHPDPKKLDVFWYIVDYYSGKVGYECATDSECDDGKACTTDTCSSNTCQHVPISGCCTKNSDCGDSDPCTSDLCSNNTCKHSTITGCCTKDDQCSDGNECTTDSCDTGANQCEHTPISGCCTSDADCADTNPCTTDSCDTSSGTCTNAAVSGCCAFDTDCDDGDPCTADTCDPSTNVCGHANVCDTDGGPVLDGTASSDSDAGPTRGTESHTSASEVQTLVGGCALGGVGAGQSVPLLPLLLITLLLLWHRGRAG